MGLSDVRFSDAVVVAQQQNTYGTYGYGYGYGYYRYIPCLHMGAAIVVLLFNICGSGLGEAVVRRNLLQVCMEL